MQKEQLIKLGLTAGEAKVYLSLLKLGSSTAGLIVKASGVAYSNIYEILNRLIEKGLVSFILKEKTHHYQPVQPQRLNEYIEKKEEELRKQKASLSKLIPELESLQNPASRQEAEIFIGFKGIRTAYESMLTLPKEEWLFFYIAEPDYKAIDKVYARLYPLFKKYHAKGIANKAYKASAFIKKTSFSMKYVDFPTPGNIDIYKDRLLFISWSNNPIAILITSKAIADKFRQYFYSIWNKR
ncbi:MAG TPA: helix-turn-helix domain-containing protein [Candidatus Nanoarchaeia archaeon]|nr:helix-turn-helix domain-containing protein [Candidatus Nanoarchaeia archaeon]